LGSHKILKKPLFILLFSLCQLSFSRREDLMKDEERLGKGVLGKVEK
jgi:hypothetical protein